MGKKTIQKMKDDKRSISKGLSQCEGSTDDSDDSDN